jgi:hypothetical protein
VVEQRRVPSGREPQVVAIGLQLASVDQAGGVQRDLDGLVGKAASVVGDRDRASIGVPGVSKAAKVGLVGVEHRVGAVGHRGHVHIIDRPDVFAGPIVLGLDPADDHALATLVGIDPQVGLLEAVGAGVERGEGVPSVAAVVAVLDDGPLLVLVDSGTRIHTVPTRPSRGV